MSIHWHKLEKEVNKYHILNLKIQIFVKKNPTNTVIKVWCEMQLKKELSNMLLINFKEPLAILYLCRQW
mgnify:CR=1 FL=1